MCCATFNKRSGISYIYLTLAVTSPYNKVSHIDCVEPSVIILRNTVKQNAEAYDLLRKIDESARVEFRLNSSSEFILMGAMGGSTFADLP